MIESLTKQILRETAQTKRKLNQLGFDELNVLKETDALYTMIEEDCQLVFADIFRFRYEEILLWLDAKMPKIDEVDGLVELWLMGFLTEPNQTTHYAFYSELIRKRDRAKEAILAVPTKAQKQIELDKQSRFVIQQSAWYCDFASQEAEIEAMNDAGVKWVQRHEMDDDKTCTACREADGRIYRIENAPPPEHIRCRLWLTPYTKKQGYK